MKKPGLFHNRQWLRKKYIDEKLSIREIAKICSVDHTTIYYFLKKFGLDTQRKLSVKMGQTHFYFPSHFLNALREFSKKQEQPVSVIVRSAMTEFMIANKFNPFSGRKFRDKNE